MTAAFLRWRRTAPLLLFAKPPRQVDVADHPGGSILSLRQLGLGFGVALTLKYFGLAFLGCLVGTLVGILPGVGPIATIAMLLPITFGLDPSAR